MKEKSNKKNERKKGGNLRAIDVLLPKIKQEVLAATLMNPQKKWYASELARYLNRNFTNIRKELIKLEEAGILQKTREGRNVYFHANITNPIFTELKNLMIKTLGLCDVLREELEPLIALIECAFVYGSVASNEMTHESDVDLIVIGSINHSQLISCLKNAEKKIKREINITIYSHNEFVNRLGLGDHFLNSVISGKTIHVIGDVNDLG